MNPFLSIQVEAAKTIKRINVPRNHLRRERERERENYFFAIEQNKKSGGGGGGGGHKICGEKLLYLLSQLVKSQAGGFLEAGGSDAWHPRIMGLVRTGSPT